MKIKRNDAKILLQYLGNIYRKEEEKQELDGWGKTYDDGHNRRYGGIYGEIIRVLFMLDDRQRRIIMNDFLSLEEKGWWKKSYSKSSYYRAKNYAIDAFFRCLYM